MASDDPAQKSTAPADDEAAAAGDGSTTVQQAGTGGKKTEPAAGKAERPADSKADRRAEKDARRERARDAGAKMKAGSDALRSRIASIVWLVAVLCALILAVGALLVALKANKDNAIVSFVLDAADKLDLGVFSRREGIFTFEGKNGAIKDALVNWGIGAIAYLVVGKVLDRVIRP